MSPEVMNLVLGIFRVVLEAGPEIYEAFEAGDTDLAKRRLREKADREIDAQIAKRRLWKRQSRK